jgi:hypothetical protein
MPIRSGSGVIEKVAMPGRVGPTTRLQTGLGGTPGGPGTTRVLTTGSLAWAPRTGPRRRGDVKSTETFLRRINQEEPMSNPLTTQEISTIRAMLLSGQSHNSIAKQVGRAQSTISAFALREGIAPVNQAPGPAIERRKEFALEARLEATGELMAKVREIAADAKSGREIKECSIAWGVLCDKSAIMEGLPSSRTETHTTSGGGLNLEEAFRKLDEELTTERDDKDRSGGAD